MKKTELEKLTPDQVLELINTQEKAVKDAENAVEAANKAQAKQAADDAKIISDLKAELEDKNNLVLELNQQLSLAENAAKKGSNAVTVKVDKKVYRVNYGANLREKNYTPQQIAEDENLAKEILAIDGQTILTEEE